MLSNPNQRGKQIGWNAEQTSYPSEEVQDFREYPVQGIGRVLSAGQEKEENRSRLRHHKFMGQKGLTRMGIVFCGLPFEIMSG